LYFDFSFCHDLVDLSIGHAIPILSGQVFIASSFVLQLQSYSLLVHV
jgi:hypothetical protein